jgi:hypothetical protein
MKNVRVSGWPACFRQGEIQKVGFSLGCPGPHSEYIISGRARAAYRIRRVTSYA